MLLSGVPRETALRMLHACLLLLDDNRCQVLGLVGLIDDRSRLRVILHWLLLLVR